MTKLYVIDKNYGFKNCIISEVNTLKKNTFLRKTEKHSPPILKFICVNYDNQLKPIKKWQYKFIKQRHRTAFNFPSYN